MKTYLINEVFYSLQGEGMRAGTANTFIRFAKCNMECRQEPGPKSPGGFDCDTEFESGRRLTLEEIETCVVNEKGRDSDCMWLILTGGEPGLQLGHEFISYFNDRGYQIAVETNGSIELSRGLDWITVSPKVAEHAIRQLRADEVKYVRGHGQAIPNTVVTAKHYLISPAFNGMEVDARALEWCIGLVKANPKWRLSVQTHKSWSIR